MKRELSFALQTQSQLTGSVGRTRASKVQIQIGGLNGLSGNGSTKRLKADGVNESELIDGSLEMLDTNHLVDQIDCNGKAMLKRSRGLNNADSEFEQKASGVTGLERLGIAGEDKSERNFVSPVCEDEEEEELNDCSDNPNVNAGVSEVVSVAVDLTNEVKNEESNELRNGASNEVRSYVPVEGPRRFTRSVLKLVESSVPVAAGSRLSELNLQNSTLKAESLVPIGAVTRLTNSGDNKAVLNVPVVSPKRFTRSTLNSTAEVNPVERLVVLAAGSSLLDDGNNKAADLPIEAPPESACLASNSKPKVEPLVPVGAVSRLSDCGDNNAVLNADMNGSTAAIALGTPAKNLELKMSKKIALAKKPTCLKELFASGLLEGYSVFYNCLNKGFALRGVIKDVGVLCFCSMCNGLSVVSPSQFEVHACKSYRNAAKYICLENGKNLHQVVEACKNTPLDKLEETIKSVVGSLPEKKSIICQYCKGSSITTLDEVKQLCKSCVDSSNSEAILTDPSNTSARSLKPALAQKFSGSGASVQSSSQTTSQIRITRNFLRSALVSNSSASDPAFISSKNNSQGKIRKKIPKVVSARKPSESAPVHNLSPIKSQRKITKMSSKASSIPRCSKNSSLCISPQTKNKWKMTKKDLRLHKYVFEDGGLPDGTEVTYYSGGKKLLEGYRRGLGIFCRCCNSVVSPSQFEAHAGQASRRKPYHNIYTSNGVSLHEFAISLGRTCHDKENDDLCIICADGGDLLLCDLCPRAFHMGCASLSSIPRGKWYCNYCQNMFQREKFVECNDNAIAAGRVSGVDPIEQITKLCIRIVRNPEEAEVIACVLCRGYDLAKSGFGPRRVIVCDQCEKEYHVGCLKTHEMADLKELPKGKWFCCMDCRKIYSTLQNLLIRGEEKIPDSLLDVIIKKHVNNVSHTVTECDVRWRVLSGKFASPETRLLLSKAVAIFHECFNPIVDSDTGRDFIPSLVYGRKMRGQDFGGMYCAVLTVNSSVVSVGIFRVFGQEIAELPLVATCNGNQGKGYFQLLFSCIEKLLAFLNVKVLVLPAADEAVSIWTHKFGFKRIPPEQLSNYRKICWQVLSFKGTSMLHKMVPHCQIIQKDIDVPLGSS